LIGHGATLEEAFESAAVGMFALMSKLASVRHGQSMKFEFEEADVELALVRWLNRLFATVAPRRVSAAQVVRERPRTVSKQPNGC
jgi:SHS2 domain-containing protein